MDDFVCEAYLSGGGKWKRYNSIDFENLMGEVEAWILMPEYK